MSNSNATYLMTLHGLLNSSFSLSEIRTICFELNVDYDSIAGEEKPSRIRELLLALGRNGRLPELLDLVQRRRPDVTWPPAPPDLELPADAGTTASVPGYHDDGDQITVGDISGAIGVAIGRNARAEAHIQPALGGADLANLFVPLLHEVAQRESSIVSRVQALQREIERADDADDVKIADLITEIATAVPTAVDQLVTLFTHSAVARFAGGATRYVLRGIQR